MSGYLCILNLDGAPAEPDLLARLTQAMAFRGPDATGMHVMGNVGFGHTMLRTTVEAETECQPCRLADDLPGHENWIVGDCRIDARDELVRELKGAGRHVAASVTDPELILHAYAVWGQDCVLHLLGDFAFVIRDSARRQLFCARDQMGAKLLFYACCGNVFLCGNTVNALRLHPAVSAELNDLAVADFLVFGHNQDPATTTFRDIRRLPAAHRMIVAAGEPAPSAGIRTELYWTLPVDPPLRLRHRREYPEHYLHLFRTVVRDRMRTDRVGIMMSGGLDSTSIAAIASQLAGDGQGAELRAYTNVFDSLIPDQERHFATLAAEHMKLPVHFIAGDHDQFYDGDYPESETKIYDPAFMPMAGPRPPRGTLNIVSEEGFRVLLYGEGPDGALHYEWKPYFRHELKGGRIGSLVRDVVSFPFLFGHMPFSTRRAMASRPSLYRLEREEKLPQWLNPDLVVRLGLEERFTKIRDGEIRDGEIRDGEIRDGEAPRGQHPVRPVGHAGLTIPMWQFLLEHFDAGVSGVPVEVRHPFLDIRMLRFLLSVPVLPWCRGKYLMRRAIRGLLPPAVVERPKTAVAGFPLLEHWKRAGMPSVFPDSVETGPVSRFVNVATVRAEKLVSPDELGLNLRPVELAFFLREIRR